MTTTDFWFVCSHTVVTTFSIWEASSRVGVTTSAKGPNGLALGSAARVSAALLLEDAFLLRRRFGLGAWPFSPVFAERSDGLRVRVRLLSELSDASSDALADAPGAFLW